MGQNAQDLIICRNVLIYIDNESCIRLMNRMNKSLIQGGYLMLGASDPVNLSGTDFIFHNRKGSLFYRPLDEEKAREIKLPEIKKIEIIPLKPIKKVQSKNVYKQITPVKIVKKEDVITKAINLANDGKLNEAVKVCEEGFKLDPTNKFNYFTYGLAMSELNKLSEAESALRKTLFLDNQFVVGHFQLGLLLLRKNQHQAGLKSLKNALAIAESKQSEESVPGSPGLSYKDFAEILRKEIDLYMTAGT